MRFTIEAWQHPRRGWVMLPVFTAGARLAMMLNTGASRSAITRTTLDGLIQREVLPPERRSAYMLTGVTLAGTALPNLFVRVLPERAAWAEVDGILGLEFLRQFTEIHFDVGSFRLTLTLP